MALQRCWLVGTHSGVRDIREFSLKRGNFTSKSHDGGSIRKSGRCSSQTGTRGILAEKGASINNSSRVFSVWERHLFWFPFGRSNSRQVILSYLSGFSFPIFPGLSRVIAEKRELIFPVKSQSKILILKLCLLRYTVSELWSAVSSRHRLSRFFGKAINGIYFNFQWILPD